MSTDQPGELQPPSPRMRGRRHPLVWMIARRLGAGVLTLLASSLLVFLACNLLPGDAATASLGGKAATPQRVAALRKSLGLDQPVLERYVHWLGGILIGHLGNSLTALAAGGQASISKLVFPFFANSLILAVITLILLVPLSTALGVFAAAHSGKATDHATSAAALVFSSLPEFVMGSILVFIFFQWLGWFPPVSLLAPGESPLSHPSVLVLPVLTLLTVAFAGTARYVRANVIEVFKQDYVTVAQLNGLPRRQVWLRYTLRNAFAPCVQIVAQTAQYLLGGIIIVESVFNYPGIGAYLVSAVGDRDIPVVEAVGLILAAVYICINVAADVIVVLLVPSLRTSQ